MEAVVLAVVRGICCTSDAMTDGANKKSHEIVLLEMWKKKKWKNFGLLGRSFFTACSSYPDRLQA